MHIIDIYKSRLASCFFSASCGGCEPFLMSLGRGCVALHEFIAAPHEGGGYRSRSRSSCPGTQQALRFGCQKLVRGVVAATGWCMPSVLRCPDSATTPSQAAAHNRKKLETIESNSFARNHRRVKLRDNIVSCPGRNVPASPRLVLNPER